MRLPITRHGILEILIFLGLFGGSAAAAFVGLEGPWKAVGVVPLGLLVFVVAFFRDPHREVPPGEHVVVAPADGKVTDIIRLERAPFLDGPAIRIGIFLSVFDVHVNRSPVAGSVAWVHHRPGAYLDARDPACSDRNEAQDVGLVVGEPGGEFRVLVRQVAGLVARRIVCKARVGDRLGRGERYGMIKLGSRTEVYLPADRVEEVSAKVGVHVKGGRDVIGTLRLGIAAAVGGNAT